MLLYRDSQRKAKGMKTFPHEVSTSNVDNPSHCHKRREIMLLCASQQSIQILWDLNYKSLLVLPTHLLFPYLMGRRKSPLKAVISMSSTTMQCIPSSLCQAGEVSLEHRGQWMLHGDMKVHLKWAGHELLEEDNLVAGRPAARADLCMCRL